MKVEDDYHVGTGFSKLDFHICILIKLANIIIYPAYIKYWILNKDPNFLNDEISNLAIIKDNGMKTSWIGLN